MNELFFMATIANRHDVQKFSELYRQFDLAVSFISVGSGTAASETLDTFGLESSEKVILFTVVTAERWHAVKGGLQKQLRIDVPGTGIAFIVPMSSIGGAKQLRFLTERQNFVKGEESSLKGTKYELLIVIANLGYSELIMDAARECGASGGTVIHAKGTGMERAEKFLGVSLVSEKEMLFLVVKREDKNNIMKAIMEKAGLESKAKSIVFSLPVTSTAGMRLMEEEPPEPEQAE